jgi:DNA-binding transcriptional MerR regulator
MRAKQVFHLSLEHPVDRVCSYYDEILMELAHTQHLEDVWKVRLDVERNRRIHCLSKHDFTVEKIREALGFLEQYNEFIPQAIIIDGVDFETLSREDLQALREIASERDAELWMSATTTRDSKRDDRGVPEPVARLESGIDVILTMAHDGSGVHVVLRKDHDNPDISELKLALDPTTMLLMRE